MNFNKLFQYIKYRKGNYTILAVIIAITLTVVANAISIISSQYRLLNEPSGLNEKTLAIWLHYYDKDVNYVNQAEHDYLGLAALPDVETVSFVSPIPFYGGGPDTQASSSQENSQSTLSSLLYADENFINVFDLQLAQGRTFRSEEIVKAGSPPPIVIINEQLAIKLFGTQSVIGDLIYLDKQAHTIIGVVKKLIGANAKHEMGQYTVVIPAPRIGAWTSILIKPSENVEPLFKANIESYLYENGQGRIVSSIDTIGELKERSYTKEKALNMILSIIVFSFSFITFAAVFGLILFNFQQRTKALAINRALGASIRCMVSALTFELGLVVVAGIIIGLFGALSLSFVMHEYYQQANISLFAILLAIGLVVFLVSIAVLIQVKGSLSFTVSSALQQN